MYGPVWKIDGSGSSQSPRSSPGGTPQPTAMRAATARTSRRHRMTTGKDNGPPANSHVHTGLAGPHEHDEEVPQNTSLEVGSALATRLVLPGGPMARPVPTLLRAGLLLGVAGCGAVALFSVRRAQSGEGTD